MNDEEWVAALELGRLPADSFSHRDHVRAAWIYCRALSPAAAAQRMSESVQQMTAIAGHPEKYHYTKTIAWMRLVSDAAVMDSQAHFDEFADAHPALFDSTLLLRYYSRDLVESARARSEWVEPDILPLPAPASPLL